jgi:ATP-dependent DNA helicase RecG
MEFLLRKSGKTWDDVVEPRATLTDIDEETVKQFKADAAKAGRLPTDDGTLSLDDFLDKLRLTENGQLKRAAIVIFGKDPGRFYPNQIVKIGRFGAEDDDLKFQEVVEGIYFTSCAKPSLSLTANFSSNRSALKVFSASKKTSIRSAADREIS